MSLCDKRTFKSAIHFNKNRVQIEFWTTFATEFLPAEAVMENFLNADLIAAGLPPFAPL